MKTPSIYRARLREKRLSYSASWALEAGIARGRRDSSLAEARASVSAPMRQHLVGLARHEHAMYLTALRAVRAHERIAAEFPGIAAPFVRRS
jgi:hypothetical protein